MRLTPLLILLAQTACSTGGERPRPCGFLPSDQPVSLDDRLASGKSLRTLIEDAEAEPWRVVLPDGSMRPDVVVDMRLIPTGRAWRSDWVLNSQDEEVIASCPLPSTVDLPITITLTGRLWEEDIVVLDASYEAFVRVEDGGGDTYITTMDWWSPYDPRENLMGEVDFATDDWFDLPEACGTHRAYQTFAPVADLVEGTGLWPEPTFQFTWLAVPDDCHPVDPLVTLVRR